MPAYSDTLEWYDGVPGCWPAIPIKHGFRLIGSGTTPPTSEARFYDGTVPWVNTSELRENIVLSTEKALTIEALHEFAALRAYPAGTVLFAMYGATIGRVAILGVPATVNQAVCALAAPSRFTSRFAFYGLQASREFLAACSSGGGQPNLNAEKVREHKLPCPDLQTQRAIADYLDRETARLDALVAAKERVLGLLAEKRRSLITRAVTRGLDPRAPLRDSGIPWLGMIPAHWEVVRLRFLTHRIEQGWSPQAENREPDEQEWGVLKLNAVNKGRFHDSAAKALPPNIEPVTGLEVHAGDFLLTRSNTPALVGDVCFVEVTRPHLMLCDLIYRLALRVELVEGRFLAHFLSLPIGRRQVESDARGTSASMVKIAQEHIKDWLTPLPPVDEQEAIVKHLTKELMPIQRIVRATERTIVLLKERRAVLIAAAVTRQLELKESLA